MIDHDTLAALDPRFTALGILPGPAGAFLLPAAAATTDATIAVAQGRWQELPLEWQFLLLARDGHHAEHAPTTAVPAGVNAAIAANDALALAQTRGETNPHADQSAAAHAAAVAFRIGATDEPPPDDPDLDPRVRAYLLATYAHDLAQSGEPRDAVTLLRTAADIVARLSPAAAARYLGEAAALTEPDARTVMELQNAAASLEGLHFEPLRGELLMAAADALMAMGADRPALLQQAVIVLQKATQALPRREHPVAFAVCHMNIAVAYLSMPMNEHAGKLRGAIAVQSLREALDILTAEEHPELWESATLNLANALQHLPSAHVGHNLTEAVDLYTTVLARRTTPTPARARTLASQANALAHLARYDDARPLLAEARAIFSDAADADALAGIDAIEAEMLACTTPKEEAAHG